MEQSEKLGVLDSENSNYFFSKMSVFNIYEFLPQEFYLKTETV